MWRYLLSSTTPSPKAPTGFTMASAYKSAMRAGDSDESDSASESVSSHESSDTMRADSSDEKKDAPAGAKTKTKTDTPQINTDLRNRVLMLTSRGVSYRSGSCFNIFGKG
jgi:nucleosome binding factor SPN SPT16 subunit